MNDGSDQGNNSNLRREWSILVQSFVEDEQVTIDTEDKNSHLIENLKSQGLTFEDFKLYSKHLSVERHSLNNQIEEIKKSIEDKQQTIENLVLVSSDPTKIIQEIENLNELGEQLSQKMILIEIKSKNLRAAENLFFSQSDPAGL